MRNYEPPVKQPVDTGYRRCAALPPKFQLELITAKIVLIIGALITSRAARDCIVASPSVASISEASDTLPCLMMLVLHL